MGVNEIINKHNREKNAFEKRRYKEWIELKERHEAEIIGRGETTPEMQNRFSTEIALYSKTWKARTYAFNKRQYEELQRELEKEEKEKQFKRETNELNKTIQNAQNEHSTHENEQQTEFDLEKEEETANELDDEKEIEQEEQVNQAKQIEQEISERERRKIEYLENIKMLKERNKDRDLER